MEAEVDIAAFFDDSNQDIDGHGGPDLCFHRILRGAVECLDAQVLFDPFEQQFDLPTITVQFGDGVCGQGKIIAEQDQSKFPQRKNLVLCGVRRIPGSSDHYSFP